MLHYQLKPAGERRYVVYFAGRPVGNLSQWPGAPAELRFFSTDHLGTLILESSVAGKLRWGGGFEPFGGDFSGAQQAGIFLRFPGQWHDDAWASSGLQSLSYYNVRRWYHPAIGSYSQPDPARLASQSDTAFSPDGVQPSQSFYGYALQNPVLYIDPLGLKARVCCRKIPVVGIAGFRHCYIEIERDGRSTTCGLIGGRFSLEKGTGEIFRDNDFDDGGDCGAWNETCGTDECVVRRVQAYPNPSKYRLARGPNSNTFAGTIARACGLEPPGVVGSRTPGWNDPPAEPKEGKPQKSVACSLP
ncbi:MAG: hypothetical protein HC897_02835 [Thermoanaerobaculia bacterium]|nr:hypothetical protein [Thermoanaerobaculia bacterium]